MYSPGVFFFKGGRFLLLF